MQMAGHAPSPPFMVVQLQLQLQLTVGANINWLAVQFIYCKAKRHEIAKLYSAVNLNSEQLNVKFISDSCSLITFQSNVEF